jgi:hypothetical protein
VKLAGHTKCQLVSGIAARIQEAATRDGETWTYCRDESETLERKEAEIISPQDA